ncbi:MAG TPA: mechanosensitive ion channel family protein, partial [Candidatus Eisenbacteria bacterium]|nr:mechanosensitive ion channel family protein [Candidatus Eisenbacteria bacterium]
MPNEVQEKKELNKLQKAAEETAEQTAAPEDIERHAGRTTADRRVAASKLWFIPYLIAAAAVGTGILFLYWKPSFFTAEVNEKLHRYLLGALAIVVMFAAMRAVEVYLIARLTNAVSRFNLKRILRLLVGLGVVFIVIPVLFVNWKAAVVSLGLVSLILG